MDSDAIEEAAARWFVRRGGSGWTEADEAAFVAWLDAATIHRIEFIRVEAAWQKAARMKALGAGVPPGVVPARESWGDSRFLKGASSQPLSTSPGEGTTTSLSPREMRVRGSGRRRLKILSVAASVVAAYCVYISGYFAGDRYTTPVGGLENLRLTDGSHVTLNTDTSIRVRMTEKERHIELIRGEAFFEVAKDPAHPFVVYAGDKGIMAVGTKFSVRRDSDDVQVVVTEGEVKLAAASALSPSEESNSRGEAAGSSSGAGMNPVSATPQRQTPVFLFPGAIARTSKTEVLIREHATPDTERLLSWRSGYVNFQDTALSDAVAEFNRYNVRRIVVADPVIGRIRIGGNFRANNTEAFLALLQGGFPIAAEKNGDTVILKPR